MWHRREEGRTAGEETEMAVWTGEKDREQAGEKGSRRILGASRGRAKVYFMAAENDDPESGEAAGKLCADSFLRRPSLKDVAMETIGVFMNNAVLARHRPSQNDRFDAAAVFIFKDQARALLSGRVGAWLFVDGQPYWQSAAKQYPDLGRSPAYQAQAEALFDLPRKVEKRAALLLCSGMLSEEADIAMLKETLAGADSPGGWLKEIMPVMGEEKSALAAFLPPRRGLF